MHAIISYLIRPLPELKELGCSVQKLLNDMPQNVANPEQADGTKKILPFQSFLEQINNTGELLENSSSVDDVKRRRCIRMDIASKSMDEVHYIKFSKARRVSFVNKNHHKFSDWICSDGTILISIKKYTQPTFYILYFNYYIYLIIGDVTMSKQAYTILSYLAYETVAQIVDLAFLVRQDQGKIHGDAIDRQRLNYVNPFKPRYHNKVCIIVIKKSK